MIFRVATIDDIPGIQVVRNAVRENRLSDPGLVTDADCADFITRRGRGWVCVVEDVVAGFAIADMQEHNIWALFVHPDYESTGIGKQLHRMMIDWYFSQTDKLVWLGTAPGTRAEEFYTRQGWQRAGMVNKGEVKFEMHRENWPRQ